MTPQGPQPCMVHHVRCILPHSETFKDASIDPKYPDDVTMDERKVLNALAEIKKVIRYHERATGNNFPVRKKRKNVRRQVGVTRFVNRRKLRRAWNRQDYEAIRAMYAEAYCKLFDNGGLNRTPQELLRIHRKIY